jgi:hypothetical protein
VAVKADRSGTTARALPITMTGSPAPAGKCSVSTVWPVTESGCPRKPCAVVRPLAFRPVRPIARTPRITAVMIQVSRALVAMRQPTRAHVPLVVGSAEP